MSLVRRLRWGASQVSTKQAGAEFARVVAVDALPGTGWRMLDQRAWKTGQSGASEPWARRAREARLLTAWRSFEQSVPNRWLWIQVTPLASELDADAALEAVPSRLLANLRAEVKVTSGEDVESLVLRRQRNGWAHEQRTTGPRGSGLALYAAFVVGSTLTAVAASGGTGSWDWPQLLSIGQLQADLL